MAKKTSPATPAAATLTDAVRASLAQYGAAFASTFAAIDLNISKVQGDAAELAVLLFDAGADTKFEAYTLCREAFTAGIVGKSADAVAKAWTRAYAAARDCKTPPKYGARTLPKGGPASTEPGAVAKAAKRAEAAAAEAADTRTPAELLAASAAAAQAGKAADAVKLAQMANKRTNEAQKAAADAVKDKVTPLLEKIAAARDTLRKANDVQGLEMLARVAACLAAGQHAKVGKAIKGLSTPVAEPAPM